jgi:hypothetical protein
MIKEIPIEGFNATLTNSVNNYPQSTNPNAPKLFFNLLSVASRGGSKTYTATKLIKDYEEHLLIDNDGIIHPLRSFLISPTFGANKILENLKSLDKNDIYEQYSDDIFQTIINEIERTNEEVLEFKRYTDAFELIQKTPKKDIVKLVRDVPEILEILNKYNYIDPDEIDVRFRERPVNFIILDDLMGSSAFNKKAQSLLTYYLIKNRHHFISFFILVQSLKSVPKPIRQNCNVYFLGKFASKKYILDDLYEEVSNVLTEQEFADLYDHAIQEKYGSLIIDTSGDTKRFYKGLDKELIIE